MKKVIASVVALGCLTAAGTAFAGLAAGTGVNGSLHDMTKVSPATADVMGRVCVYCHTPHHATKDDLGVDNYPLWNHKLVDPATYTPYSWATAANDVAELAINPLIGPSRLCMSCHDGAIAIDQHGDSFGNTKGQFYNGGGTTIADRAKLTNDLSNTHPIGFNYLEAVTIRNAKAGRGSASAGGATEIVPATYGFATDIVNVNNDYAVGAQGTYNEVVRNAAGGSGYKLIGDVLYQGQIMTCATCHEVHNKENAVQDAYTNDATKAPNYFLYAKENQSLICLSCHVK